MNFPQSAYELAISDWYFSLTDHRSPHDSWLDRLEILEANTREADGRGTAVIRVRLLNAWYDRYLEFFYPQVYNYRLDLSDGSWCRRDWRYDEFRLSDDRCVIHEIEWAGPKDVGRWLITASDMHLTEFIIA